MSSARPNEGEERADRREGSAGEALSGLVIKIGPVPLPVGWVVTTAVRSRTFWTLFGLAAAGWLIVLYFHRFRFDAGVLFLALGWLAVVLIGHFLWKAAFALATEPEAEGEADEDGFEVLETRRGELEREKRALLKAIKEVEFDKAMGKMSAEDAEEIVLFYRARAIEVLRQLERIDRGDAADDAPLSVAELIDREVRARLALMGAPRKPRAPRKEAS